MYIDNFSPNKKALFTNFFCLLFVSTNTKYVCFIIIHFIYFKEIIIYYHEQNAEIKSKMYDSLINETIPFYVDRFEKNVSDNNGYFVNGKVCIFIKSFRVDDLAFPATSSTLFQEFHKY